MSAPTADDLDRQDMIRLVAGHDGALDDLMDRHAPRLYQYLLRSLQNEQDAADLSQETFVRVYQNCARFDPRQKFTTWLYTIASNLVRDRFRWRSRHPQVSLDAEPEGPGHDFHESLPEQGHSPRDALEEAERAEAVRKAVTLLPEELRAPLILAEYEGLSQAEIGEILKCTPKAAETRIYRARQQLRRTLRRFLEQEEPPDEGNAGLRRSKQQT